MGATIIKLVSNCKAAIKRRQKKLNEEVNVVNLYKNESCRDPVLARKILSEELRKQRAVNDLLRADTGYEVIHTLVKDGTIPIRHQAMSRVKARKLNYANAKYGLKLRWVLGKQKLKKV